MLEARKAAQAGLLKKAKSIGAWRKRNATPSSPASRQI
jgi:hypothetical protein